MKYDIPEVGVIELNTIVLDLNGTLAVQGKIIDGVKVKIDTLKERGFSIYLFTGDQRGNAGDICDKLGIQLKKAVSSSEKEALIKKLPVENTVAIGNARIDIGMFKHAKLSICTLQKEGIHVGILKHVDIMVTSVLDALDLLIDSDSLKATMRK